MKPSALKSGPATGDVWMRWFPIWHAVLYMALALSTLLALSDPDERDQGLLIGCAVLLAAWHWGMLARNSQWSRHRIVPLLIYFAGALALFVALTFLHPVYMLLAFWFYVMIFALLRLRWAISGAVILTAILIWREVVLSGEPLRANWSIALPIVIDMGFAIAMALFVTAIIDQSRQRQRLIEELEAARHDLAAAERQAGILEERQRLAREIHDTLAQGFTSIVMHLEVADQALPPQAAGVRQHLDQARRTARESLAEARRLVWALRPEQLEQASLPDALERLARRTAEETGLAVSAAVTGTPRALAPDVEVTLLRAAQEALANVRKHAGAGQVTITLSYMGDLAALDVQDDGVGFDLSDSPAQPGDRSTGGFGLLAMRQRAEQLGGTLTIESAHGEGTTLVVELPA